MIDNVINIIINGRCFLMKPTSSNEVTPKRNNLLLEELRGFLSGTYAIRKGSKQ